MLLGDLTVAFRADTSGILSGVQATVGILGRLGEMNPLAKVAVGAAIATVAIGAFAASAVKAAGDFQGGLTTLVTGAGELESNIGMVGQGLLKMSVDTGASTQQLISGMFMVESAGFHGAAGLDVMRIAAEGAKVGNADLGTVANTLTTILHDYHLGASSAADAMNALTVTVQSGKTHLQDLAFSMGNVLPLAAALGVSFPQVAGAIAEMTNSGMTAQRASMNLANALRNLGAPSSGAQKTMKEVGITAQQLKDTLSNQGLAAALQLIETHVSSTFPAGSVASVTALKSLMGGAAGYNVMLMLGGRNMADYEGNIARISGAMTAGKGAVLGWAAIQGDFNFKIEQAHAALNVMMITVGQALLPVMTQSLSRLLPLITGFTQWAVTSGALAVVARGLGAVIGLLVNGLVGFLMAISGVVSAISTVVSWLVKASPAAVALELAIVAVTGAMIAYKAVEMYQSLMMLIGDIPTLIGVLGLEAAGWWANAVAAGAAAIAFLAAEWPILLIGAAIALLIVGIILLVTHWGQVVSFLQAVWSAFTAWFMSALSAVGSFFVGVWTAVASFFVGVWNSIVSFFQSAWARMQGVINVMKIVLLVIFAPLILAVASIAGPFIILIYTITHFQQVMGLLHTFLAAAWAAIVAIFQTAIATVVGWFSWLYNHNYYFADLVNSIRTAITLLWGWFVNAWNVMVNAAVTVWNWLASVATTVWNAIVTAIENVWTTLVGWFKTAWAAEVQGWTMIWNTIKSVASTVWGAISAVIMAVWNTISGWLRAQWNTMVAAWNTVWSSVKTNVQAAWNTIAGIFQAAWGHISSALASLWSNLSSWFSNLAAQALQWGANIIQNLANGITGAIGWIKGAASNVMGVLHNILGFHSPTKEGLGQYADRWAPALMTMFAAGITAGVPAVRAAALQAAVAISGGLGSSSIGAAVTGAAGGRYGTTSAQNGVAVENHFYIDGREMTNQIMTRVMSQVRAGGPLGRTV